LFIQQIAAIQPMNVMNVIARSDTMGVNTNAPGETIVIVGIEVIQVVKGKRVT
jgi:hypothetical protein